MSKLQHKIESLHIRAFRGVVTSRAGRSHFLKHFKAVTSILDCSKKGIKSKLNFERDCPKDDRIHEHRFIIKLPQSGQARATGAQTGQARATGVISWFTVAKHGEQAQESLDTRKNDTWLRHGSARKIVVPVRRANTS